MTKNIDTLASVIAKQNSSSAEQVTGDAKRKFMAGYEKFLTTHAAAAILQPFMPRKNAQKWLLLDAQHQPIIPVLSIDGENFYRWVELANFAIKILGANADDVPFPSAGIVERRGEDRRASFRRRGRKQVALSTGIERRCDFGADRRINANLDRRKNIENYGALTDKYESKAANESPYHN